ncbi:phosphatidylglycerophosphatase A family protein [Alteromonas halophila]|uniref:Phosphatidylglycerophosphatase A n=1 Tax=Alteromonas halophila TaxID=516698 RepID=A0A918JNF1_9ALTE|nr:phosphatidylglycerophosphatase A [Alteromonas halophila]GGW85823.1 phosphatidylglycerophosphatase A [Alteromonas halophila]
MQSVYRARITMRNPVHFMALGFGSGLIPFMPGTWGSLAAIPLIVGMAMLPDWAYVALTAFAWLAGNYLCGKTAADMGVHDHGSIVWDEVAGMLITFLFIPIHWQSLLAGFVLFRVFDILKPWPIGPIDKHIHGGAGIMLDDVVAGIMACGSLHLISLLS